MQASGVREIPVVEGRALVGIIAHSDLTPFRGHFEWTRVRQAMTEDPVAVGAETLATAVAKVLLDNGFNSVPVTSNGELLGMISRQDLLRLLAKEPSSG
jgi:CBS domain-containing protein